MNLYQMQQEQDEIAKFYAIIMAQIKNPVKQSPTIQEDAATVLFNQVAGYKPKQNTDFSQAVQGEGVDFTEPKTVYVRLSVPRDHIKLGYD